MRALVTFSQKTEAQCPSTRVIVVWTLCLIGLTRTQTEPLVLAGIQVALLVGALLSGVGLFWLFTRSLVVLPFTGAALPLIFTVSGSPLFSIAGIVATEEGLTRWLVVVAHCWLCYQFLLVSIFRVGTLGIIDGLSGLRVPRKLIDILRLALRYLDLLVDEATRLRRARELRTGSDCRPYFERSRTTGSMIGTLFLRSLDRAARIQLAQTSRGGPVNAPVAAFSLVERFQIGILLLVTAGILGGQAF